MCEVARIELALQTEVCRKRENGHLLGAAFA